jgi:hypothetical protein
MLRPRFRFDEDDVATLIDYAIVTQLKNWRYGRSVPKNTCQARSDLAMRLKSM